jgi:hypothetical protein
MVVAILNLIFVGQVPLEQDEVLGDIIHVRKHGLCNLGNVHKRAMLIDFMRNSGTKLIIQKGRSI